MYAVCKYIRMHNKLLMCQPQHTYIRWCAFSYYVLLYDYSIIKGETSGIGERQPAGLCCLHDRWRKDLTEMRLFFVRGFYFPTSLRQLVAYTAEATKLK
jgi:hypothetical protein